MSKPSVIVSDLHLGAVPNTVRDAFIRFTQHWLGEADLMLINGDLFDFWFEYRAAVLSEHFQVLRALADLRESGVRLILVGGNHDAWGGPFLEREIGIELVEGPLELEIAGHRALVAHGDGLGPGDHGYKLLRRTLRSGPARRALRWVHPDFAQRIVRRVSQTADRQDGDPRVLERSRVLEEYARQLLMERSDLDLVIFGHCHVPQLKRLGEHGHYLNSGDWVTHRTYTVVTEESIKQLEWEDEAARPRSS